MLVFFAVKLGRDFLMEYKRQKEAEAKKREAEAKKAEEARARKEAAQGEGGAELIRRPSKKSRKLSPDSSLAEAARIYAMPLIPRYRVLDFSGRGAGPSGQEAVVALETPVSGSVSPGSEPMLSGDSAAGTSRQATPGQHATQSRGDTGPSSSVGTRPVMARGQGRLQNEYGRMHLVSPVPRDRSGDERAFRPDWALTEEDTAMGDIRAARELLKGSILPRDRMLVDSLTTSSVLTGVDTLSASVCNLCLRFSFVSFNKLWYQKKNTNTSELGAARRLLGDPS